MDRVNGANTVDIGGGRRGFRSQNAAAGIAGTEVTAEFMNDVQEEICKVISEAGIELDPESQQQLYEALLAISAPGYGNRSPWLPVISMAVTAPPNDAVVGDTYCIPAGATGAWAGKSQDIAEWTGSSWRIFTAKDGHGIGLPDGRIFIRIGGVYVEWLASRQWVSARKTPIGQLNSLPWLTVKNITLAAPPANPSEGDLYIIATGASGAWAGKVGQIAEWSEAAWRFSVPSDGHGVSLPDGRVFERTGGVYVERIALDVQSGKWSYGVASGSADAITVALTPAPSAYSEGLTIRLKLAATNTGEATLNMNGLGAKAIVRPDGGALIAGDLAGGGIVELVYDGTRFVMVGQQQLFGTVTYFSSAGAGTVTVPQGCTVAEVELWGGGGGGGFGSIGKAAAGGGGGAYAYRRITGLVPGSSINYVVGTPGAAGFGSSVNGGAGGTTSFGGIFSATGGSGGIADSNNATGGGVTTGATIGINGGVGGPGLSGGSGSYGAGAGGDSPKGGSGGAGGSNSIADGGKGPGGGGSGGANTNAGGPGSAGAILIRWS